MPSWQPRRFAFRRRPQGLALIGLMAILMAGVLLFLVGRLDAAAVQRQRELVTGQALAQAKEALIGWAAARGSAGNPRPGELPCPDTNAPGTANAGFEAPSCAAGAIGRLPWRTLGIEELKDGYGEAIWYAIDGAFRKRPMNNAPLNSDTRASMVVYQPDGTTLLTPPGLEAVAVVFSPGPALGSQLRGTATEQTTAANYLDAAGPPELPLSRNNATPNGPFVQGPIRDAGNSIVINDRLVAISANDLMAVVERRVARETLKLLADYFAAHTYYPNPARYDDPSCLDVGNLGYFTACTSDSTQCRGRIPADELTAAPGWYSYNLWGQVIYYAVSTNKLATLPSSCAPSASAMVDGSAVSGVLFMPGPPAGTIVRNAGIQSTLLSDYLDDAMNQDGWTGSPGSSDQYCSPGRSTCTPVPATQANDRLYVLP